MALVAMCLAVGWAGATTAAAQTQTDTDFSGGTHTNTEVVPPGDLTLSPVFDVSEEFDGTELPTGWESTPWNTGGTATVAGGALTVDGARANTTDFFDAGRSLDFAATFTADPFQHVGFGNTFEDGPWAMFSTGNGGSLPVGLYARTLSGPGGTALNTPIAGVDPLVEHDYSIEWTPTEVRYFVDGTLVATHAVAITAQMRPIASDFGVGDGSVRVENLHAYSYPTTGTFTSRVFDAGDSGATWQTLTAALDTPAGTGVSFETRTGPTPTPDASWTAFQPVGPTGDVAGGVGHRYIQYRVTLTTTDTSVTPVVHSVTLGYEVDTEGPVTTVTNVTLTGTNARVTFTSETGATFECSLDNGAFESCTSPKDYTGLPQGSHTVRVRATDQAGNTGPAAERTFTVDTVAPVTTIGGVTVTGTTARVTFTSETGATFECSLDGGQFQTCISPKDYTNLSQGSHTVRVRATDQAGNTGPAAERTFTVDTVAPVTTVTNVTVTGTNARVTFTSEAGATFECSLDNGAFESCTSPKDYTGLPQGSHTVRVRAIDQAGNVGAPVERTFVVDTAGPVTTIGGVTVTGTTAQVTFSSETGATFQCSLDGGAFQTCTSPKEYIGLSHGSHTVRVRATDQAGNVGQAAERTFTVDTVAPVTSVANVTVTGTTARVTFSSEAGATFQCSLDGGAFQSCTSPKDYTGLSQGEHTVRVRAIDQAGNVGPAAERGFTVDTVGPATTIGGVTVSGTTARVTFDSEAGATFECSLDGRPFQSCTSPREYTGLSDGSHTVRVRATDRAGNVGSAAERSFVISDTKPPKVRPKPRSVRVSSRARFVVRLRCPSDETRCSIRLRIRYRGETIASKRVSVRGGHTARVALRLKPFARDVLEARPRLRVFALTTARDASGNRATTRTRMMLRAPAR